MANIRKLDRILLGVVSVFVIIFILYFVLFDQTEQSDSSSKNFYFVQFTDTHWENSKNIERTRKIVEQINDLPMPIQCVVFTGDMTTDQLEDMEIINNGLSALKSLKAPILFLPGNHDILRKRHDITKQIYEKYFGPLITQQEFEGVIFITIYTEPLAQSFPNVGYNPLQELEKELKQTKGKPVLLFHHTPSVEDFYLNSMHDGWEKDIRGKWEKLLNSYNVKAVLAGHFHRDEHHWIGEIPLYVCAPVGGKWGRQATFRIFEYKNGKLSYRTQYIEE